MKKLRIERTNSNVNALSQKRNSLNHEPLFVPYKIDWRPASPSNIENQSNSKVFFQNMKAELSTIKNDFEKLIRREINLKLENDQPLKPTNTNRTKSYSTSRKEVKVENVPKEGLRYAKDQEEQLNRILNLQKNLPCSSKTELKQTLAKSLQVREQRVMTSAFTTVQIRGPQKNQENNKSNEEIKSLKERIVELQKQVETNHQKIEKMQEQNKEVRNQINQRDATISNLRNELQLKNDLVQQLQQQINNIKSSLDLLNSQHQNIVLQNHNLVNQRNVLHQHLSELSFHHNQLNMAYTALITNHKQQSQAFGNLQRFCEDLQRRCADIQADGCRKIEYLQKDIQEYQKRQDMFSREIENLKVELKQKPSVVYPAELTQKLVNEEIERLKDEVVHLTRQVEIEKQLHQNLSNKCIEQLANTNNMEQITRGFEEKVSHLLEQNTKLKCRVNLAEAQLESMSLQNKSYLEEIRLYQERQKFQMNRKKITTNEWEELTEEIEKLKTENAALQLQIQLNHNREVGQKENRNEVQCEKLLNLSYHQRTEIEGLKQNILQLMRQNDHLRREVAGHQQKSVVLSSANPIQELSNQLALSREVNTRIKQVLFQFAAAKTKIDQEQEQPGFYLRKLEQLKREIM